MRFISQQTRNAWLSSYKGGSTAPCVRATIEPFQLVTAPYDASTIKTTYGTDGKMLTKPRSVRGNFAVGIFNAGRTPKELPNIKSARWDVSVDTDTGSLTLELWNSAPLPIGQAPVDDYTFDLPGYFSAGRGGANEPAEWGNVRNEWQGMLAPDRVIRLYAGYGFDSTKSPDKDPYLYPFGVWMIDDVAYSDGGTITVQCRDVGRLLMDQIAMPPVIPQEEYPLTFSTFGSTPADTAPAQIPSSTVTPVTPTTPTDPNANLVPAASSSTYAWRRLQYSNDTNKMFVGRSLTNNLGAPLVNPGGDVSGHYGIHAFDSDMSSFWFSVGAKYTTVPRYVEGFYSVPLDINAISVKPYGGPYNVWISLKSNGVWQGTARIPYTNGTDYIDSGAVIPYVKWGTVTANTQTRIDLPVDSSGKAIYKNVTVVRVTFTSLKQVGTGDANWHAGCYDIQVSGAPTATTATGTDTTTTTTTTTTGSTVPTAVPTSTTITVNRENIGDYSQIATWIAAWGGFFWPAGSDPLAVLTSSDGTTHPVPGPTVGNPALPSGGIWGDIEEAGTSPVNELPASQFDKRPLADALGVVRDILGFNLFFNELGGIVFRSPNIWSVGNYVSPISPTESPNGPANLGRTPDIVDLKDDETILSISTTLSSRNIRETVAVGNTLGSLGATAILKTNNLVGPYQVDLRRQAVWTDSNFATAKECLVMAELIMLRQAFTYRTTRITIPGNPAIQIDDQVRVWDRMSANTFLHYVSGISSSIDMRDRKWTFDLTTHWLGTDPFTNWAFAPGDLSEDTRAQVKAPTTPSTNVNTPGGGSTQTNNTTGQTGTAATGGTAQPDNYGWFHTTTTYTQASIAARFQISVATLKSLNPKLGDPVAAKYQVKVRTNYGAVKTPIESVYTTYGWWQATASSYTVASVAASYGVSVNSLRSWNQWLVGNTVVQGQWVQVRSNADPLRTS